MTKYQKVIEDIKNRITNGIWAEGFLLPSELELCSIYDVSRITIRRALEELSDAGYVVRVHGKGTFASKPMQFRSGNSALGFSQHLKQNGIEVTSRLSLDEQIEADSVIRKELLLKDVEKDVWHFRRVRIIRGIPIAVMDTYVRLETSELMHSYDLEKESFFSLYTRIYEKNIGKNIFSISALIPEKEVTKLLKIKEVSAGILLESTAYLEDGRPIQYDRSIFNPAYYKFTVSEGGNITPTSL